MRDLQAIALGPTASLSYYPQFVDKDNSRLLLENLTTELDWEQSEISLFGKKHPIPRLNAWYGDKEYAYSGTQFKAKPLTPALAQLKAQVQLTSGLVFNSVLVNWYRDGQDSMGWHSDDEKCLGDNPQIASVSLGDSRRFTLRERNNKSNKHTLVLEDGSLLLMLGETQSLWQHALPKTKKPMGSRVNLTFRMIQ